MSRQERELPFTEDELKRCYEAVRLVSTVRGGETMLLLDKIAFQREVAQGRNGTQWPPDDPSPEEVAGARNWASVRSEPYCSGNSVLGPPPGCRRTKELIETFERFTDRARRVVVLAQEDSRVLGYDYIGTEHLLLGIMHGRDRRGALEVQVSTSPAAPVGEPPCLGATFR